MVDSQAVVFTEIFSMKMFQLLTAPQKAACFLEFTLEEICWTPIVNVARIHPY